MAKKINEELVRWMHVQATSREIGGRDTAISAALKAAARKSLMQMGFDPIFREELMKNTAEKNRAMRRAKRKKQKEISEATKKLNQIAAAWHEHMSAA